MRTGRSKILAATLSSAILCVSPLATSLPAQAATGTVVDLTGVLKGQFPNSEVYRSVPNYNITAADAARATITPNFQATNVYAQLDGGPTITAGQELFAGEAFLENRTNITQKLLTDSFEKRATETLSQSVTTGLNIGATITYKAGLPNIYEITRKISFEKSSSDTTETSQSITAVYTAPSQAISVPPNTIARVQVFLQQNVARGKVKLHADIGGTYTARGSAYNTTFRATMPWASSHSVYNTFQQAQDGIGPKGPTLPKGVTLDHNRKTVSFDGTGAYSVTAGSDFKVKVSFKSADGQTAPAPRVYTVPAQ